MAIASFVTSTAGLLFFGGLPGPVGLGLGIAALRRIKVSGKAGRGWAIAGIAVGAVGILWMLAIAAYIVFVFWLIGSTGSSSGIWDEFEQGFEEGFEDGATGSDPHVRAAGLRAPHGPRRGHVPDHAARGSTTWRTPTRSTAPFPTTPRWSPSSRCRAP